MRELVLSVALIVGLPAGAATAQDYPSRPVTLVVPFAAGGSNNHCPHSGRAHAGVAWSARHCRQHQWRNGISVLAVLPAHHQMVIR